MIHILMFRPHGNVVWDKGLPRKIAHGSANIQAKSIIINYHSLQCMLSIMLYRVIHDTMGVAETHSITKHWEKFKRDGIMTG